MPESPDEPIVCEACKERVAELFADDGRAVCSPCHLRENRTAPPRHKKLESDS